MRFLKADVKSGGDVKRAGGSSVGKGLTWSYRGQTEEGAKRNKG